ncbi:MAG TPA: hypothetical protein VJ583_04250 [Nitrososphaeraceae archaeon]|nr:hypothetical protein [Nitrososphaeraceae archaeon]
MAKIAIILLLIALGLEITYGMDVIITSQSQIDSERGFLPLNEDVRGVIFGGGAVALSVIGFAVGRKEPNKAIPILLFINGGLIILGMIIVISMPTLETKQDFMWTIGSTMIFGGILIGLGIAKIIIDKKKLIAT